MHFSQFFCHLDTYVFYKTIIIAISLQRQVNERSLVLLILNKLLCIVFLSSERENQMKMGFNPLEHSLKWLDYIFCYFNCIRNANFNFRNVYEIHSIALNFFNWYASIIQTGNLLGNKIKWFLFLKCHNFTK